MADDDRTSPDEADRLDDIGRQLTELHGVIDELTTLLPRATGPTAGVPGRIADALGGIEDRLAAVERMGREQFELDQRLSMIDQTLGALVEPIKALAPHLRDLGDLATWLARVEERVQILDERSSMDRLVDGVSMLLESAVETSSRVSRIERAVLREPDADGATPEDRVVAALDRVETRLAELVARIDAGADDAGGRPRDDAGHALGAAGDEVHEELDTAAAGGEGVDAEAADDVEGGGADADGASAGGTDPGEPDADGTDNGGTDAGRTEVGDAVTVERDSGEPGQVAVGTRADKGREAEGGGRKRGRRGRGRDRRSDAGGPRGKRGVAKNDLGGDAPGAHEGEDASSEAPGYRRDDGDGVLGRRKQDADSEARGPDGADDPAGDDVGGSVGDRGPEARTGEHPDDGDTGEGEGGDGEPDIVDYNVDVGAGADEDDASGLSGEQVGGDDRGAGVSPAEDGGRADEEGDDTDGPPIDGDEVDVSEPRTGDKSIDAAPSASGGDRRRRWGRRRP